MKNAWMKLVKVKSIVTLAVIAAFVYLAVTGKVNTDSFMLIVTTIVAFYFGTQKEMADGKAD